MSAYEFYVAVHVLMAVAWVGGALCIQFFAFRVLARDTPDELVRFTRDAEWIGTRVFIPASLFVVVFGALAVWEGPWEFSMFWISAGLAMFAISFLVGALFLGPESGRISKLIDQKGAADPEVGRRIRRILLISRAELVLLVLIVLDMVFKPGA